MFEGRDVTVIDAVAGSGKTHKLMEIITKELRTRRPEEIAFVTFTKKGADEGLRRVCNRFMYEPSDLPYFRTLHSLTFHALNLNPKNTFGKIHERKFNKETGYWLNRCEAVGEVHLTRDSKYLEFYDMERSGSLTSKQRAEADIELGYYHQLVQKYEEYKSQQCLVDFFDCLIKYVREGDSLPCKVLLVDEAQDVTALQWQVIDKAFAKAEKIYIAGDTEQSIYTYSGARPDYLIDFAKRFPVINLKESYRIPRKVYMLAKGIVSMIREKTDKPFDFHEGNIEGSVIQLDEVSRIKNFMFNEDITNKNTCEWYLLARNKCFLTSYTRMLEENVIPYWTSDGFFMGGEIMQRLKDYEGFRLEGYKDEAKKKKFMDKFGICDFNSDFTETNLFTQERKWIYASYVERYGLKKLEEMCKWNPQILVSSIHYVKGGEAKNVSLLLDMTSKTHGAVYRDIDEELRVLYVGVTRAKENLYLVDSKSKEGYNRIIETIKDEFGLRW